MKSPSQNPLLIKELREEVRSRRILVIAPVFIAILSAVSLVAIGSSSGSSFNPQMLAGNARYTMFAFCIAITILLGLVSAILGAYSFTTEKEKATYELLELTPLSYPELVLGKFFHCFLIVGLVLLTSLPVLSTLFFMGGLSYSDILLSFFYLLLFFAVVTLGAICISIMAGRTLMSIIFSLLLTFTLSIALAILSGVIARNPGQLGFAAISPWLVMWQQIFQPTSLRLAGHTFPVWLFYSLLYLLLALLLLFVASNALDSRKLERNVRTRLLGLLLVNLYVAVGLLCFCSYSPFTLKNLEDFYQSVMLALLPTLPFFAMGTFTDKDRMRFRKKPLLESVRPERLFLNDPVTGFFFLCVLLLSVSATMVLCTGVPLRRAAGYLSLLGLWILPWFLIFTAQRLRGFSAKGLFVTYLLGTFLYTLLAAFQNSTKSPSNIFEFYLVHPLLVLLYAVSLLYHTAVRLRLRKQSLPHT